MCWWGDNGEYRTEGQRTEGCSDLGEGGERILFFQKEGTEDSQRYVDKSLEKGTVLAFIAQYIYLNVFPL